jgi:hypothetical protein
MSALFLHLELAVSALRRRAMDNALDVNPLRVASGA